MSSIRLLLGWCLPLLALIGSAAARSISTTVYVGRHFEVRDHDQPTKYVFNGATRVAEVTGSLLANPRIQRLRLNPGWNLCSLAVSGPFPASGTEAISAAYEWNAGTYGYSQVTLGQSLAAGAVLWLKSRTNAVLSILGAYTDPAAQGIRPGGDYLAGAGLEAWSPVLPESTSAWTFNAQTAQWNDDLPGALAMVSDPPPFVSPGEAVFVQAASPVSLDVPDPALRIRYYHQDHLGSSSVIADANGGLVQENALYAFGVARNEYAPRQVSEHYEFTQKERDRESRLDYFEARYFAGTLARFVCVDPKYANAESLSTGDLLPQELNLYAYAGNGPLIHTDPTGLGWLGDAYDYVSDNLWIPGRDSLSDLDVGRTAKVAGGVTIAVATGGAGLGVEFAVAGSLVGADQVTSGILDRPSYLSQAGSALCGGNENCGSTLETTTLLMMGGASAAYRPGPTGPPVRPGSPPALPPEPTPTALSDSGSVAPQAAPRPAGGGSPVIGVAKTVPYQEVLEEPAYNAQLAAKMNARISMIAARRAEMDALITAGQSAGRVILQIENALDIKFPVGGD